MGVTSDEYLPTEIALKGASGILLPIKGCIMARITIGRKVTHQIMYVLKNPTGSVLSREALIDLGVIPADFPKQMQEDITKNGMEAKACDCAKREPAPEMPKVLPFEPIKENRQKLEDWIWERYKKNKRGSHENAFQGGGRTSRHLHSS